MLWDDSPDIHGTNGFTWYLSHGRHTLQCWKRGFYTLQFWEQAGSNPGPLDYQANVLPLSSQIDSIWKQLAGKNWNYHSQYALSSSSLSRVPLYGYKKGPSVEHPCLSSQWTISNLILIVRLSTYALHVTVNNVLKDVGRFLLYIGQFTEHPNVWTLPSSPPGIQRPQWVT